jgi:hypothetical protein
MIFTGIDPGAQGALCRIHSNGELEIIPFKPTKEFTENLHQLQLTLPKKENYNSDIVYLEKVHSMPAQGVASAFSFGLMTGIITGMLLQEYYTINYITPQEWQKELRLVAPTKNMVKLTRKKYYWEFAQKLFPDYAKEITLDVADAVLIAEYARRKHS